MSEVRLESVAKVFKDTVAVDHISLTVKEGEFFSLLGPSGCGKTTTLRMVGGFELPTEGQIYLDDTEVSGLPPYRRDVNTVFQSYALFPHLDVAENVAFGLKRKKVGKDEVNRRVQEALELVSLAPLASRKPSQLSGGQQQRIALARALVNRPKVLLLDEPLGALYLKLRKHMQLELKRIQAEVGITFIYVTHDQEEAMTMSDRLAVMRDGRIEQVAPPEEVYEHPATSFVASFLGASNLLTGKVKERSGDRALIELPDGGVVTVPADRLPGQASEARIGVRPEKIRIERDGESSAEDWNSIAGTVRTSTFIGVSHQYTVEGPGKEHLMVYEQNLGAAAPPRAGDRVRLLWRPEHTFAVAADESEREEENAPEVA
jgi:spermidine/putrescine transport system ATP-binding protein